MAKRSKACGGMFSFPYLLGCPDNWTWDEESCSGDVRLHGPGSRTVEFHRYFSNGTAGARGLKALNNGRYYWELELSDRVFGTSMMFGIGTKEARLHSSSFTNLIGENEHSWGLSHRGLLWHRDREKVYTKPFRENEATTVGLLFDGINGTLTYYKDGENLGIAFTGLQDVKKALYPMVSSTSGRTEMSLLFTRRDVVNLQERCRSVILKTINNDLLTLGQLQVPDKIKDYLLEYLVNTSQVEGPCIKKMKES